MRRAGAVLLAVALLVGAAPARGTPDVGFAIRQTSWSPDGRGIAYLPLDRGGIVSIVAPDGSSERFFEGESAVRGRWSADGRRLAWTSPLGLRVADLATGVVRSLDRAVYATNWDWAADGNRLVWTAWAQTTAMLKIATWDGGDRRDFPIYGTDPGWSPRGDEVAWFGSSRAGYGIHVMRPDGTELRFIAHGETPRWSPTGDRIAYNSVCGNSYYCVRVIGRDGQGDRLVSTELGGDLSWSPSGRWLAIRGNRGFGLVELDSGRHVRISPPPDLSVSWSPTGDSIIFSRGGEVIVASTDGAERTLARGEGPNWSPDGRRVSFLRAAYDERERFWHCYQQVIVLDLATHREEIVSVCRTGGANGRDRLPGTAGPDQMWGLGGPDVISGAAGGDTLYGGGGHDRLYGGPGGDFVVGGGGSDRIGVRDDEHDEVRCGTGRDVVFADRLDQVARDCESVQRS